MAEREELLAMVKLLSFGKESEEMCLENKSDIELLEIILTKIKTIGIINSNEINDSLAFPQETRDKLDLINSGKLWNELGKLNDQLRQDYTCRRQMLLRRLDCTVESFKWKGSANTKSTDDKNVDVGQVDNSKQQETKSLRPNSKAKSLNDQIHDCYEKARIQLKEEPQVSLAHLLALRENDCDKLLNGVISTNNVDCKIAYKAKTDQSASEMVNLKQVIIPHVPDRGGRANEHRAPQKETFAYQRGDSGFRGHRGRGAGGGRHNNRGGSSGHQR